MSQNTDIDIVQIGHVALDRVSPVVAIDDIASSRIQSIIARMKKALDMTDDGVALAAPQIGENVRIFIVSPKVFEHPDQEELVYINPTIIKTSRKKIWVEEGCLSVRFKYGHTHRHHKATVSAYNERGEKFQRQASGLLAQIFQHEIQHLDGILFIEHAKDVRDYDPKEKK